MSRSIKVITVRSNRAAALGFEQTMAEYFADSPDEYSDLQEIVAPIGTIQSQCDGASLPPALVAAYNTFTGG
jgi:hypothetical protein